MNSELRVQDWDFLLVAVLVAIYSLTRVFVGQLSFYDGFVEVTERLEEPPFPSLPPSP